MISNQLCKNGCNKPNYNGFEFCSRTCGQLYAMKKTTQVNNAPLQQTQVNNAPLQQQQNQNQNQQFQQPQSVKICKLNGCQLPVYVGYEFCSKSHGIAYLNQNASSANTTPTSSLSPQFQSSSTQHQQSSIATCKLNGCNINVTPGYEFCCRDHGIIFNQLSLSSLSSSFSTLSVTNNSNSCIFNGCNKPKYSGYDFCGKAHGLLYKQLNNNNNNSNSNNNNNSNNNINIISNNNSSSSSIKCKLQGCNNNAYQGFEFCCKSHGIQYNQNLPPVLIMNKNDPKYQSVESQFKSKWLHNYQINGVHQILKIKPAQHIIDRYENKKKVIEANGGFSNKTGHRGQTMTAANEQRRFHGTNIDCNIGLNGNTSTCQSPKCYVCRIIENSFIIPTPATAKFKWGRFGPAIYFSSTSSKSNDYCVKASGNPYKYMFLAHVLVGKGEKLTQDRMGTTQPSQGYDSVLGEVGPVLNHDEVMVYSVDQAKPTYLIIYN